MVNSISPFAPEVWQVWQGISKYQMVRFRLLRTLTLASVKRARKVFLLSELAYELIGGVLRDSQVVFLPMAPPPPYRLQAAERVELPEDLAAAPYFVAVGDLAPYKGVEDAIRAISLLRKEGADWKLVVCGRVLDPRYGAQLRTLAEDARGGVVFVGSVNQEVVLALMRRSLGTLVCSRIENPNRVPSEAMAVGSPLLAVDVTSSRAACGNAAHYYPPGDPPALSSLMQELRNPVERDRLVAQGRRFAAGNDWLSASRKILETLEML